ncbi:MAG: DUF454 family protein [Lactovum sp.]
MKKIIFLIIGFIFLGIGISGIILPVIPGGPFFLVASYCFSKSSKRFELWFKSTIFYQKYVLAFTENRGLKLKEK